MSPMPGRFAVNLSPSSLHSVGADSHLPNMFSCATQVLPSNTKILPEPQARILSPFLMPASPIPVWSVSPSNTNVMWSADEPALLFAIT